jgi:hypothetical protein
MATAADPSQPWSRTRGMAPDPKESLMEKRERHSRRNGSHSVISFSNGDSYEGEWQNDLKHGTGVYEWADGTRYVGEYRFDLRSGMGTLYEPGQDGESRVLYDGEWKNDAMEGPGANRFVFENGDTYIGPMRDNLRHGEGRLIFEDGSQYEGMFENGVRQGYGSLTEGNGDTWQGEWSGDEKHGPGSLYALSRGWLVTGVWNNGDPAATEIRQLTKEEIADLGGGPVEELPETPQIPAAGLADPDRVFDDVRNVALREVETNRPTTTATDTRPQRDRWEY